MKKAELVREYGPFPGVEGIHGVTWDGERVWFASDNQLHALDPATGHVGRTIEVPADAGTAFDGRHLYQIAEAHIRKVDPQTGLVVSSIPAPAGGVSGLAWAEGMLWVGHYRDRRISQVDPETGKVLRVIQSDRFVTGVTWTQGELWHGTWEGDDSELRHVDAQTGEVQERLAMPAGTNVSGLEAGNDGTFFCGGGRTGKLRVVRRPKP